jgi:hypothetical protein
MDAASYPILRPSAPSISPPTDNRCCRVPISASAKSAYLCNLAEIRSPLSRHVRGSSQFEIGRAPGYWKKRGGGTAGSGEVERALRRRSNRLKKNKQDGQRMQRPWRCDPIVTLWRDGFFVVVSSRWARVAGSRRALRDKSSVRDQLNMPVYKVNCPSINYYSLVIIPDKQAPSGREI